MPRCLVGMLMLALNLSFGYFFDVFAQLLVYFPKHRYSMVSLVVHELLRRSEVVQ
jgi:hypothetical protein